MADETQDLPTRQHYRDIQTTATGSQSHSLTTEPLHARHSRVPRKQLPANARVASLEAQHDSDATHPLLSQHQSPLQQGSGNTPSEITNMIESSPTSKPTHQEHSVLSKGWPKSPQPIKSSCVFVALDLALDIFLLALSLGFFTLGLVVYFYNQRSVNQYEQATQALMELSNLGPTVFPLLFACVVGRATQAVLNWGLEKGLTVGICDLLAGSTSLVSTVTLQIQLRIASITGAALVVLWILSPIGGQASLRQISIGLLTSNESISLTYMSPSDNLTGYVDTSGEGGASYLTIVNALYVSSIIAPALIKASPLDPWENVKIPMIEPFENGSVADSHGWFDVGNSKLIYSSLVGVPVTHFAQADSTSYSWVLETSYFYLQCLVMESYDAVIPPSGAQPPSSLTVETDSYGAAIWSNDNSTERSETSPVNLHPRNFSYLSFDPIDTISNCTISTTYIEAQVLCSGTSPCAVSKLRRSQNIHPPAGYTLLDLPVEFPSSSVGQNIPEGTNWDTFTAAFAASVEGHGWTNPVQVYFMSPNTTIVGPNSFFSHLNTTLSNEDFAIRLGQLMNTYWACLTGGHAISGGISPDTVQMAGTSASIYNAVTIANSNTTTGTKTETTQVIICHIEWMVILCLASMILVAAVITSLLARHYSHAPGLMLNISSLATRGNYYFDLPTTGTALSASERARLLKDVRVQFGDVDPQGEHGKLVIASIGTSLGESQPVGRVRRGRSYV